MSEVVKITSLQIENNPSNILSKFRFQVQQESFRTLPYDVDWEVIYIGSARDSQYDQILEKFSVPIEAGISAFTLECEAADISKIPTKDDLLGPSAIIFSVSYCKQEFLRVGYYLSNYYTDPVLLEYDPVQPVLEKIERNILWQKPRITRYDINWDIKNNIEANTVINNCSPIIQGFDPFEQSNGIFEKIAMNQNQSTFLQTMFGSEVSNPFGNLSQQNNNFQQIQNNQYCNQHNQYNQMNSMNTNFYNNIQQFQPQQFQEMNSIFK